MSLPFGTQFGPYEITALIGVGGMGEVYRARDRKLGREVAIKVLPEGFGEDKERLRRFELEAKALAALNHPNILAIHELGAHGGMPYLVMELLEGESLRERLAHGALPVLDALGLALQMAGGLAAAHAKGIIHRDLKPANLFITRDGLLKILDFGLAKQITVAGEETATRGLDSITGLGLIVGSIGYMSPEQISGKPVDARSDLFAFGLVLFEMLTGVRAFERGSVIETLSATLKEPPPSLISPNGPVPPPLQDLVNRCLEKDPARRHQQARELIGDLEAARVAPLTTGKVGTPELPAGHRRLRPWQGVAAVAVAAVAVVGSLLYVHHPETVITSLAVLPLQNYSGDAQQDVFVDGMTDALISGLAQIRALKVISRTSVMQYKGAKKTLPQIARELGVQGILEGSVLRAGNRVRISAQLIDARQDKHIWAYSDEKDCSDVLALQREVVREVGSRIRVEITPLERGRLTVSHPVDPVVYEMTLRAQVMFEHADREPELRKAIAMFQSAVDKDPGYAPAWAGLAVATWNLAGSARDFVAPEEVKAKAIEAADKAVTLEPELPEAQEARGEIAIDAEWDLGQAKLHLEKALELRPGYAYAHIEYVDLLHCLHEFASARQHIERTRELDPFSPFVIDHLLINLIASGQPERALREGERLARAAPDNRWIPCLMGLADLALDKFPEAVREFGSSARMGGWDPGIQGPLGYAYGRSGQPEAARRILAEFILAERTQRGSPLRKAAILIGLGRHAEAYQCIEQAFAKRDPGLVWGCCLGGVFSFDGLKDPRWPALRSRILHAIKFPGGRIPWDTP